MAFLHTNTKSSSTLLFTVYLNLLRQSPTSTVVSRSDSTLRGTCSLIRVRILKSCPYRTFPFALVLGLQAPKPVVVYPKDGGPLCLTRMFTALPYTSLCCVLSSRYATSDEYASAARFTRGFLSCHTGELAFQTHSQVWTTGMRSNCLPLGVNRCRCSQR